MSGVEISANGSAFEEFHERHRDGKDGKRLAWMIDFYRAKEGVIHYHEAPIKWRVLELAKKTSWGNKNRDYPADESGNPLSQRQLANMLNVKFQRVSEAVDELIADGFLRREGRILIVIDDPAAQRAALEAERRTNGKQKSSTVGLSAKEKREFLTAWARHDPEQFKAYQTIGKEIEERFERQRQMQAAALEWFQEQKRKSGTGRTNSAEDPERGGENVRNGGEESSGTGRNEDGPILSGFTSYLEQLASSKEGEIEKLLTEVVGRVQSLKNSCLAHLPGARLRAIRTAAGRLAQVGAEQRAPVVRIFAKDLAQLATRDSNRPQGWGIVPSVMEDAIHALDDALKSSFAQERRPTSHVEREPTAAEQVENLEALLSAYPGHVQAQEWREQLSVLKGRKPAESEPAAKAQKAGQR